MSSEQEFVAHLFAPLDGPRAEAAAGQLRSLWERLDLSEPIPGLAAEFPADLAAGPVLAGAQDATSQVIARRDHDVLNVSLALTGSTWADAYRRWQGVSSGGTDALLGVATLYLAKGDAAEVRAELPPDPGDGSHWWERGGTLDGFAFWEVTPRGLGGDRRLIVISAPDEDVRLSRFCWSDGGSGLPPFGRYLLHAAKLRYLGRVRGDGRELSRVRERTAATLDRITQPEQVAALAGDMAVLDATVEELRRMRRSVEIARHNMGPALPSDEAAGEWLSQQLAADADYLGAVRDRADRAVARLAVLGPPTIRAGALGRVEQRIGFGVDVISYSSRTTPAQFVLQERVAAMTDRILAALGIGAADRQPAGDGLIVVLPATAEAPAVLPGLLHGWRSELAADNATAADRIRLRVSVGSGPFTAAALGFTGRTVIEVGRLLDCAELRTAARDQPDADLVTLVSGRLYADVVAEGYPGLEPDEFTPLPVAVKELRTSAWLWRPSGTT